MTGSPTLRHSRRSSPRAGIAWAALAVFLALGFVALGSWQVERRAWKLALIEQVEERVHAPAVAPPGPDRWAAINATDDAYRHVAVTGTFIDEAETLVQASTELGAGFWVLTPLRMDDGSTVLVNRGFVAERREPPRRDAARTTPATTTTVTVSGLLRITEPGGGFLRHNDPASNRWYSRDVAAIAAARGLQRVAPYFIDADASPAAAPALPGAPVGGLTVVAFANNHAVYAITWFTLALMSGWAAWRVLAELRS